MSDVRTARRRATDITGGLTLVAGGLVFLLPPLSPFARVPLNFLNPVLYLAGGVIFFVGALVLARGIRGESGITGASTIGKAALIFFGARDLVFAIFGKMAHLIGPLTSSSPVLTIGGIVTMLLSILFIVAALVAATAALRARVVPSPSAQIFLGVAIGNVIVTGAGLFPFPLPGLALLLSNVHAGEISASLIVILGAAYFVQGIIGGAGAQAR